ncbi:hypothetical protein, partial [Nocardia asiatica]
MVTQSAPYPSMIKYDTPTNLIRYFRAAGAETPNKCGYISKYAYAYLNIFSIYPYGYFPTARHTASQWETLN